ncbi:hypothetical protein LGFR6_16400 [Lactococcus garvieae]
MSTGIIKFLNNLGYIIGLISTLYIILILRKIEFFWGIFIISLATSIAMVIIELLISKVQAYFRKK